jgi:hypothetical protein
VKSVFWVAFLVQGLKWFQVEVKKGLKRLKKYRKVIKSLEKKQKG